MIDGETVRMLNYSQAYGGLNYPQTPCTVRLGIWAGGDASMPNGTIEWAGGASDYTKGPYTMYVQQAEVKDYGTGAEYHWGDHSGSWQSIQSIGYVYQVCEIFVPFANKPAAVTRQQRKPSTKRPIQI
jgi:hypothetical protein